MNEVLEKYNSKMAYFVASYLVERRPKILEIFKDHIVAPHGYLHLDYSLMPTADVWLDMKKAMATFKNLGFSSLFFRAPYGNYRLRSSDEELFFKFEAKLGIKYDSSVGLGFPPWKKLCPIPLESGVTILPFIGIADDVLIENRRITNPERLSKILTKSVSLGKGGLIIFVLHPIRIGQKKYIKVLDSFLNNISKERKNKIISLDEAPQEYATKEKDETLTVITGDIDTLSMIDYLRRFSVIRKVMK
jgi:peptidoglycan/xylan/chitin deacetylase (PgdA/CDA1 family)